MRRIFLVLATNLAVMLVLSVALRLLGVEHYLTANGLDVGAPMISSLAVGFSGSIISLLISKPLAKWSTGAHVIDAPRNADEAWLLSIVRQLAQRAGIGGPDVAIYQGAPNAFATGAFRDSALVAVLTGLLQNMTRDEAEAVLAHKVPHVANDDMVTLALVQGVLNTFVVFFARVVGHLVDTMVFRRSDDEQHVGTGLGFYVKVFVCKIVFGLLASMIVAWFSRQREFRDDAGSSRLPGTPAPMMAALARPAACRSRCAPSASPTCRLGWACSRAIRRSRPASRRCANPGTPP